MIFSRLLAKFFGMIVETAFYLSRHATLLKKLMNINLFSVTRAKNIQNLIEKFSSQLSKQHSKRPVERFRGKDLEENYENWITFHCEHVFWFLSVKFWWFQKGGEMVNLYLKKELKPSMPEMLFGGTNSNGRGQSTEKRSLKSVSIQKY